MVTEISAAPVMFTEQQAVHDESVNYVTGKDTRHAMKVLIGYAGTGKTFTTGKIIATLKKLEEENLFGPSYRIAMSAPTHKAVRVLKKFAPFPDVEFATIHSLLGLREVVDERTGKISYEPSKDEEDRPRITEYNVLFIDETSMLSSELFLLILPYVKRGQIKLIFLGDPAQIPPVGKTDTIPFQEEGRATYNIGLMTLSEVRRQAHDNPILEYATRIRQVYKTAPSIPVATSIFEGHGIECMRADQEKEIRELIRQYFGSPQFAEDPDYMKIIAYRNTVVNAFNKIAREEIYKGQELQFIKEGEKLIMDKSLILSTKRVLLSTNQEIDVNRFTIETSDYDYMGAEEVEGTIIAELKSDAFKYYNTHVNYFDVDGKQKVANIRIAHEDEIGRIDAIVNHLKKMAMKVPMGNPLRGKLWREFYKVQRMFAQVKYNYAITAHKSQGSTYDNCMMIEWDINDSSKIEERNRIKYVAATRARNRLFIVN